MNSIYLVHLELFPYYYKKKTNQLKQWAMDNEIRYDEMYIHLKTYTECNKEINLNLNKTRERTAYYALIKVS